jgi:hypothetical protein
MFVSLWFREELVNNAYDTEMVAVVSINQAFYTIPTRLK